ncbi:MAG: hypothetical protein Q8K45_04640 [Rubrivivax sp.]|nr:hypothetical protein [Rubrivivax sp.]
MFELVKILCAGKNALATCALAETEQQRVRAALLPGEQMSALVRGRVKKAGAAFWVLTDQRLLVFELFGRAQTTVVP